MSELLVEMRVVVSPGDRPRVQQRGDEIELRPAGTGEVALLLLRNDVVRWYRDLTTALAAEGWCDPLER